MMLEKFVKSSLVQAHAGAQVENNLLQVQAATKAQIACQTRNC